MNNSVLLISFFGILLSNKFYAQKQIQIGIDETIGNYLPLQTEFTNSNNQKVTLESIIDKPVLLAFVYYECPGICNTTLTNLAWVVDKVKLNPGIDFKVITISIDHGETSDIAKQSKENYLEAIHRKFPKDAWIFLTSDSLAINKVTKAAGVHFQKVGDEYKHPGGLISISPKGKICRYLFGTEFNQFDVKMALLEAQSGKTNPTIAKVLQLCFSFDPVGHSYQLNFTRIIGSIMLIGIGSFLFVLIFKKNRINKNRKA